jgi:hypothetical protein
VSPSKHLPGKHTSSYALGEFTSRAKPGLLILYHMLFYAADEESILNEVREKV